ncbi:MAG: glycoside hydrolase family 3 C-terminal domain-containing protein, partial [Deltaproteobacteria bacterium]|nr:glycoside hydrolase family 3 C-terminal domain-containing protein [Deltaproteobacteria bacterium]
RALGITTALSPQIDIATDPRWYRFKGTFGPDPALSTDMARAYIDGFQSSSGESVIKDGWGYESVNAMAKHWPGGGAGEGGRDAHFGFGKFAVYPGGNIQTHMDVFINGAFKLAGETKTASAIMPYYTISFDQNPEGENVGNAFSRYFITDFLRNKYGYDGVVCTDWGVTRDDAGMAVFGQTPWGVENLSVAERHYKVLMAGGDQFGGNNDAGPVIEAYEMGVKELGEEFMRKRFEKSAIRLLRNIFRVGLFENPYLDIEKTKATVGNPEFMKAGYDAQVKSIVMLKNRGKILPLKREKTVYILKRYIPVSTDFWGNKTPERWEFPINPATAKRYFNVTDNPDEADAAIVMINSPDNGSTQGYSKDDAEKGGNGFVPVSLQYGEYTALEARETSIAGDIRATDVLNRAYKGKAVIAHNSSDLKLVQDTRSVMKDKPVIVIIKMSNPTVVKEFEKDVDALLVNFDVQDQAILDIISGNSAPSGLLPFQMPADMSTVEKQSEDLPFDMDIHRDSEGNSYDFGFGMNWQGVIRDKRTERYCVKHD